MENRSCSATATYHFETLAGLFITIAAPLVSHSHTFSFINTARILNGVETRAKSNRTTETSTLTVHESDGAAVAEAAWAEFLFQSPDKPLAASSLMQSSTVFRAAVILSYSRATTLFPAAANYETGIKKGASRLPDCIEMGNYFFVRKKMEMFKLRNGLSTWDNKHSDY